jgi:hypothetical protein
MARDISTIVVRDILEEGGLEVFLVNTRDTKNLPGRKSDVQESQWSFERERACTAWVTAIV